MGLCRVEARDRLQRGIAGLVLLEIDLRALLRQPAQRLLPDHHGAQVAGTAAVELLEGERDDEPMLLHRTPKRQIDGVVVVALLADQADQRPVSRLVVVLPHQADPLAFAVLDHGRGRQHGFEKVPPTATQAPQQRARRPRSLAEHDHRIVRRGPLGGAADHLHAVGVGPDRPHAAVRHQRLEFQVTVHHHVERDVDRVAVIAAQRVEPALHVSAGHGEAGAARAAERTNERAGQHCAEIDGKDAETEQQPVDDLAAVPGEIFVHAWCSAPGAGCAGSSRALHSRLTCICGPPLQGRIFADFRALLDSSAGELRRVRMRCKVGGGTPQRQGIERRYRHQIERQPDCARDAARDQRGSPGEGDTADLVFTEAMSEGMAREESNRNSHHHEVVVEHIGRRQQAAAGERRRLEVVRRGAPPQPHQRRHDRECERALRQIGHCDGATPHAHSREQALDLLPAGATRLQHHGADEGGRVGERDPCLGAERGEGCGADDEHRHGRRRGRAPAAGDDEHQRNQHAELRLVGEQAEQDAGEDRPCIEQHETAAQERRGQEAVLTVAEIDEGDGKREREHHRLPARHDRADGHQIGCERQRAPDQQRPGVGNERERRRHEQEHRRVVPSVGRHIAAVEGGLLGGVLALDVVGRVRLARQHKLARRPYVGEVGADRLAGAVDQAVGERNPDRAAGNKCYQQHQRIDRQALPGQPAARSDARNDLPPHAGHATACAIRPR